MRRNRRILHIKPCSKKYEKRNAPESRAAENNCKTMRQRRGERRKPPAGAEGCRKGLQKRAAENNFRCLDVLTKSGETLQNEVNKAQNEEKWTAKTKS
jgi:hypothetical protein